MNKRDISDFYNNDVPAYACYDNMRKICGTDGLKISQRKLIWAGFNRCYDSWIKTDTMCAQTQIDTNYIHGAANLESVIDNMAADYVGANNYPLFTGNSGGFGCRISTRPSAGRYTRIKLSPITKVLFKKVDNEILEKQFFEGQYIEPKFLIPIFPTSFLNGSHGMSTGFSHDIYPRNPEEIIEYIKKKLNGTEKPRMALLPWFKGHLGKVEFNKEMNRAESFGVITKNNMTSYTITELPIDVDYQKYKEYLDKLCDNGTIVDYNDKCDSEDGSILFELKTTREFTRKYENDERKLYEILHLIKSLPETLCVIDENNRAKEYSYDVRDILDNFIEIRLKFYQKRKDYLLATLKEKLGILVSKYLFVKGVTEDTIKVNKKKKDEVIAQLEKIDKIIKVNDTYDYLLAMQISSLTREKLDELKKQIEDSKDEWKRIKETSIETMWIDDLSDLKKVLK